MQEKKFVTVINCMDGRVQEPVIRWMKENYGAQFVDMITEPGPEKILAERGDRDLVASIKKRVEISVHKHGSVHVAVAGHFDCAGNPCGKEEKLGQIRQAAETVRSWNMQVNVIELWIGSDWQVQKVKEHATL